MAPPVIVVGSGLAGLSAASQLISHNIPVQLLEQASKPGGNSIKASSGINAAPTKFQPISNDDQFYNDTVKSAGNVLADAEGEDRALRERLISAVTRSSAEALYWLTDNNSIDLSKVAQLGGHTYPRTHRGAGQKPPGASIVGTLLNSLGGNTLFTLKTDSKVTKILRDGDEVVGVEVEYTADNTRKETLYGPVIFATGGFAGDSHGLLAKYRPDLTGFPSTNEARQGSQPLLVNVGAVLVDMEYVQVHPTGFIDPQESSALVKFLAAEMLRGEGGVLLSADGNRFVNELDTREKVTDAIMNLATPLDTPARQWDVTIVLDEGAAIAAFSHMGFYQWKGLMRKTTISNLGESALQTLQEYAEAVSGEKSDPFGRKYFGHWNLRQVTRDTIVYVGKVTPVVHFTMGGVRFNERAQVLGVEDLPIQGLWAAGEITGGLHGRNRLAGSSLLECVVFGRTAGDEAATFYKSKYIKSA